MNRVTEITVAQGDSANGEAKAKPYETIRWFYNGNEQQPYKSTGSSEISTDHYEEYYSYDSQGRLVSDSTGRSGCNCYDVRKYNWSNNKILGTLLSGVASGQSSKSLDSAIISDNNSLGRYSVNSQANTLFGTEYTYDNKINPLHTLNIHNAAAFSVAGGIPSVGYSENNNTEVAYGYLDIYPPGPVSFVKSQIITYTYSYNSFNLPVDCKVSGNIPIPSTIKFYYTN